MPVPLSVVPGILVGMKTSGWVATAAAGVVLVGGGAWAATTLPASDDGEVAAVETPAPTVEPSVTPTPEVTPTPTPTPEVVETPEPVEEPERDPRASGLQDILYGWGITTYADADVIAAADQVCSDLAAGVSVYDITVLPDEGKAIDGQFVYYAKDYYC